MFCSHCAMPNLITAGTCTHCGSVVSMEQALRLGRKVSRGGARRYVALRWLMLVIPLIAAVGTAGTLRAWRAADGADVAAAYTRGETALAANDIGGAVAAFTVAGATLMPRRAWKPSGSHTTRR